MKDERFKILKEFYQELKDCLQGFKKEKLLISEIYQGTVAIYILNLIQGYVILIEEGNSVAARVLIRTALEACFKLFAVQCSTENLAGIASNELEDDLKQMRLLNQKSSELANEQKNFDDLLKRLQREHPESTFSKKRLSAIEAAQACNIESAYQVYYRLYSKHTHAAFRAAKGDFDVLKEHDNKPMCLAALIAANALAGLGVSTPDLKELIKKFESVA